jgi:probable addiction module antidote protein
MPTVRAFDATKYRDNPIAIAKYLNEALSTKNPTLISIAIGDMARAQGMTGFAKKSGVLRESLYRSFKGHRVPAFDMVFNVLIALDLQLIMRPASKQAKARRQKR